MSNTPLIFSHRHSRLPIFLIFFISLIISETAASQRDPFEHDVLLVQLQASAFDNRDRPYCIGGGLVGNYFYIEQLSSQFIIAGGPGWFDLSLGAVGVPLAISAASKLRQGSLTFREFWTAVALMCVGGVTAFENLVLHIPVDDRLDLAASLSLCRIHMRQSPDKSSYEWTGTLNPGIALTIKPGDRLVVTGFAEVSMDYNNFTGGGTALAGGIRIGGAIPNFSYYVPMHPRRH